MISAYRNGQNRPFFSYTPIGYIYNRRATASSITGALPASARHRFSLAAAFEPGPSGRDSVRHKIPLKSNLYHRRDTYIYIAARNNSKTLPREIRGGSSSLSFPRLCKDRRGESEPHTHIEGLTDERRGGRGRERGSWLDRSVARPNLLPETLRYIVPFSRR